MEDTTFFITGRVLAVIKRYRDEIAPPFNRALLEFAQVYEYSWHTPGHTGGTAFLLLDKSVDRIHIARFDSAAARDAALRDFETTYRRHIGPAIGRAVGPWLILVDGHRTMPALERLRTALGQLAAQQAP